MPFEYTYKFKAIITLHTTEMGGRTKPIYSGYRPSFSFNSNKHYSGVIQLIGKEELQPGESAKVLIKLLPARTIRRNLKTNHVFAISEGNKTIGSGVIEKVSLTEKEKN